MTWEELLGEADARILERGRQLVRSGDVTRRERSGEVFRARVAGSAPHPYRVTVDLAAGEWSCTCPYDGGPVCKHVAAVALGAREAPESFGARPKRSRRSRPALENLEEDEAYALLQEIRDRYPQVVSEFAYNVVVEEQG